MGGGRLFDVSTGFFFTKRAVTPEQKFEKWLPRWEMNGLSKGYKQAIDQNWGGMAKVGFFGQKTRFFPKKKPLLNSNHVLATTGKGCSKKKVPFE